MTSMKPDLSDRKSFQMPFHISARDMDRFAELSLDTNSIHMKDESAIEKGFQSRVVYGGLLVSVISRFIGTQFPGEGWVWHDLSIQFRSPLYIDQHAVLNATVDYLNEDLGVAQINFEIKRNSDLIASARVQSGRVPIHPESSSST